MAPCKAWSHWNLRNWTGCLVAGDSFRSLLVRLGCGAVTIGMPVAVAMTVAITIRWCNGDRLARVRKIGRHRLRDVADRANLHNGRLRLLQHQLFVNRADL